VAWYVTRSLPIILATFALGLTVGWLWWGRMWRRLPFGESDAVRVVSDRYQTVVAERDAEITRIGEWLQAAEALAALGTGAAAGSAASGPGADADSATPGDSARGDADPHEADGSGAVEPDAHGTQADSTQADSTQADGTQADSTQADSTQADSTQADSTQADRADDGADDGESGTVVHEAPPDDLQRIEGVGPRIAAALEGAGLHSYQALAGADDEQLSAALREAGLSFAPSLVTWRLQARLLATGDEEALAAIKAEITAGRSRPARPTTPTETGSTTPPAIRSGPGTEPIAISPTAASGPDASAPAASLPAESGAETVSVVAAAGSAPLADLADGDAEEDELERIEGIGPRIATALRKAGIHTYQQLAETDAPTLQAALAASGLRFAPSLPTWSPQAALLAEGDEAGFLALTRTLVPDREGGRPA
jgi:predicted flap endonuclease-1-like 5' DNA nuclease